jgi:cytosine/adenosine deaminase-related metal-dependent hydrolase
MNRTRRLIRAAVVVDGAGVRAAPGAVLFEENRIIAAGTPASIGQPGDARVLDLPDAVVFPALVNAHCHLDLSHIGPLPYGGEFALWAESVRERRAVVDKDIRRSVECGVALSRAGGTALIGDIAGARSLTPLYSLRASGLAGVSYLEVFGIGRGQTAAAALLQQAVESCPALENGVALGLQPHAP